MKNNYMVIAEIFKKRRIEMELSKRKLAALVNISDTEITRIENGERENYNIVTLINICNILELDFVKLLYSAGYLPQKKKNEKKNFSFFNNKKHEKPEEQLEDRLDENNIYIIFELGDIDE